MVSNTQKFILGFLTLVILSSSIYILLPENVRIDIENTKTTFKVWEDNSWVLSGIEYTKIYDGTTLLRANSRSLSNSINGNKTTIIRTSNFKDNITTIDTYEFDGDIKGVENVPVNHEIKILNAEGKILQYEVGNILYTGETKEIDSPFSFGHKMKLDWDSGDYYSKVLNYSSNDKIIIKYKINSSEFVKNVKLSDPLNSNYNWYDYMDDNSINYTRFDADSASQVLIGSGPYFNYTIEEENEYFVSYSQATLGGGEQGTAGAYLLIDQNFNDGKEYNIFLNFSSSLPNGGITGIVIANTTSYLEKNIPLGRYPNRNNFTNEDTNTTLWQYNYGGGTLSYNMYKININPKTGNFSLYNVTSNSIINSTIVNLNNKWYPKFYSYVLVTGSSPIAYLFIANITVEAISDLNISLSPINYYNSSSTSVVFNVTSSSGIYEVLNNSLYIDGILNKTISNSTANKYNLSLQETIILTEGIHNFYAKSRDISGKEFITETRNLTIDVTYPFVNISKPTNLTNTSNSNQNINYTASDINLDYCVYSNDTFSVNNTLLNCQNVTNVNWVDGIHKVRVYAFDTSGKYSMDSVTFQVNTTAPNVNITFPINNSITTNPHTIVNYTYSGRGNEVSCKYKLNRRENYTITCGQNITDIPWIKGQNNFTLFVTNNFYVTNSSTIKITVNGNYTGLFIDGSNQSRDVEIGSKLNISTNSSAYGTICININHNLFGNNYTCYDSTNTFQLDIPYFRNNSFAGNFLTKGINISNGFNNSNFSFPSHKYDEVVNLSINISAIGTQGPTSLTFYKANATIGNGNYEIDRAYDGKLVGNNIYLTNITEGNSTFNVSFSNKGEVFKYFYLDDIVKTNGIIKFLLNLTGIKSGELFSNDFSNITTEYSTGDIQKISPYSILNYNNTGVNYSSTGMVMLGNSSKREFIYDGFDGVIDKGRWGFDEGYSSTYVQYLETNDYQQIYTYSDGNSINTEDYQFPTYFNYTSMNPFTTEGLSFTIYSSYWGGNDQTPYRNTIGHSRVGLTGTEIWSSEFISADDATEYSTANVSFNINKLNGTTWSVNLSGWETSHLQNQNLGCGDVSDWIMNINWTTGIKYMNNTDVQTCSTQSFVNNSFYSPVNFNNYTFYYGNDFLAQSENYNCNCYFNQSRYDSCLIQYCGTTQCSSQYCNSNSIEFYDCFGECEYGTGAGELITRIQNVNYSLYSRSNSTIVTNPLITSSSQISQVNFTYISSSPNAVNETIIAYLSADDGDHWEAFTGNPYTFSYPGTSLKVMINHTANEIGYINLTKSLFILNISIGQTYPSNITFDFGNDDVVDYTFNGWLNNSNGTVEINLSNADLSNSFTERRTYYPHTYRIPLVIGSDSAGTIQISAINLTYDPNPIYLNTTNIQKYLENLTGYGNVTIPIASYAGNFTITNISRDYVGGNKTYQVTTTNSTGSILNIINLTYFYSRWDYNFVPQFINYLEFIPKSPTSKNVSAYGQTNSTPILNITNYGYGGRNTNLSVYLNQTSSCVNLTMSLNNNKSAGTIINSSWINLVNNKNYLNTTNIWMWADYRCSYNSWKLFNPYLYFRQCAFNTTCSTERD